MFVTHALPTYENECVLVYNVPEIEASMIWKDNKTARQL